MITDEPQCGGVIDFLFWIKIIGFIFLVLVCLNLFNSNIVIKKNYECYISHVQECQDCQKQNSTYLLCSGFCVKPTLQDLDGKGCPVIHPSKNCFDLPKECNFP